MISYLDMKELGSSKTCTGGVEQLSITWFSKKVFTREVLVIHRLVRTHGIGCAFDCQSKSLEMASRH